MGCLCFLITLGILKMLPSVFQIQILKGNLAAPSLKCFKKGMHEGKQDSLVNNYNTQKS